MAQRIRNGRFRSSGGTPTFESVGDLPESAGDGDQAIVGDRLYEYDDEVGQWLESGDAIREGYGTFVPSFMEDTFKVYDDFTTNGDDMPEGYS